jgi:predicted  nucleic acid-binding Zn-ribbon protein
MASKKDSVVANKLDQLSKLQEIHTKIDQIQILKGELPIEVADLEDEIAGLNTRHQKSSEILKMLMNKFLHVIILSKKLTL